MQLKPLRYGLLLKWQIILAALLFLFCAATPATSFAQDEAAIHLDLKDVAITKIFTAIEGQTDYKFTYNKKQLGDIRIARIQFKGEKLQKVLSFLETQAPLEFLIVKRSIGVKVKTSAGKSTAGASTKEHQGVFSTMAIKGKILDANNGEPLVSATVKVKGTDISTSTDTSGNFTLSIPENAQKLEVSFVGFTTQEVRVNHQTNFTIQLETDATAIQEVVVIGYGKSKRSQLDGAVSSINSKTLAEFPAASIEQSIQGRVAGVQVLQSSGMPGAGISIRIRGVSSIAGGNEPLYVVDGLPLYNTDVRGFNAISSINPNDIESVEILKDAAATAIYGSRGGNGVVLITTKAGKAGKVSATYNAWFGASEPRKYLDLMTGDEYIAFTKAYFKNSGEQEPASLTALPNANTDWQRQIYRSALQQNHNLNFAGGTEQNKYFFSVGYLNEDGIVKNSNFERFSIRANLNNKISERISFATSLLGTHSIQNGFTPAQNSNTLSITKTGMGSVILALPTVAVRDSAGKYSNLFPYTFAAQLENPVAYAEQVLDKQTVNRFLGSTAFTINILDGLSNKTRLGVDYSNGRADQYFPRVLKVVLGGVGTAIIENRERLNYLVENYLEYDNTIFDDLKLNAIAGISYQDESEKSSRIEGSGFLSDDLQNNAIQAAQTIAVPTSKVVERSIASAFGRTQFIYKNKYILTGSIRQDGASVFSNNNKAATFPAVAFAWRMGQESFIKNISFISDLKFRLSWGKSGNPGIRPYQGLSLGTLVNSSQGGGAGLAVGLAPNLPNTNLTWETSAQTNAGLDFDLFKGKLRGTFDYYFKKTKSALSTVQLAPSSGYNDIVDNVGEIENSGIELGLEADLIRTNNTRLTVSVNLAKNHNEVTKTKNNQDIIETLTSSQLAATTGDVYNIIRVGQPIGTFLGFKYTGKDANGVPQFQDVNNDKIINGLDQQVIGSPIPEFLYGINTSFSYKRFSCLMTWQGVSNAQVLNLVKLNLFRPDPEFNHLKNVYDFYPNPAKGIVDRVSDYFVEDASFFRLRTVRLGYRLPMKKVFKNIEFYVSGQNLLTITNYTGYDPEVNSFSGNDIKQGIDLAGYPASKTYTLGFNFNF